MARRKKKRTQKAEDEDKTKPKPPQSFIFRRGKVAQNVVALEKDMRRVMMPYTYSKLQETQQNQLKDFLVVAPQMGVSHFMIFSQTTVGLNLRVVRVPRGPTLTFRVLEYSLMKDVTHMQKRPHSPGNEFKHPPLVVLNNFSGGQEHKQIMAAMFQNMFPPIDVKNVKLADCRRVVMLNMDPVTQNISFRHYLVKAAPVGLSKATSKLVKGQKIPDLGSLQDISEYMERAGEMSDSEGEDAPENKVTLAQDFSGRGNRESHKSAIRLKELGPRMTLRLLKIEEEFCSGRVLFHEFVKRTKEEAAELQQRKAEREAERKRRKAEQDANVERKRAVLEERLKKRRERAAGKEGAAAGSEQADDGSDDDENGAVGSGSDSEGGGGAGAGSDDDADADGDADMGVPKQETKRAAKSKQKQQKAPKSAGATGKGKAKKGGADDDDEVDQTRSGGGGDDSDDDAAWYKKEVGEEPDPGLFESKAQRSKRKQAAARGSDDEDDFDGAEEGDVQPNKKRRLEGDNRAENRGKGKGAGGSDKGGDRDKGRRFGRDKKDSGKGKGSGKGGKKHGGSDDDDDRGSRKGGGKSHKGGAGAAGSDKGHKKPFFRGPKPGSVKTGRPGSKEARLAMQKGKKGAGSAKGGRKVTPKRAQKTAGQKRRGGDRNK